MCWGFWGADLLQLSLHHLFAGRSMSCSPDPSLADPAQGTGLKVGLKYHLDAPHLRGALLICEQHFKDPQQCPKALPSQLSLLRALLYRLVCVKEWIRTETGGQLYQRQLYDCSFPDLLTFGLVLDATWIKFKVICAQVFAELLL